jgi:FlaA1/EpsC-like NDP-sugar epimerase
LGVSIAEAILAFPHETRRLIMITADAVAIPAALRAALALRFDRIDPTLDRPFAYFLVAVISAVFFFSVFGLYRAVIRFMGPKAMVTVIGVTQSLRCVLARARA